MKFDNEVLRDLDKNMVNFLIRHFVCICLFRQQTIKRKYHTNINFGWEFLSDGINSAVTNVKLAVCRWCDGPTCSYTATSAIRSSAPSSTSPTRTSSTRRTRSRWSACPTPSGTWRHNSDNEPIIPISFRNTRYGQQKGSYQSHQTWSKFSWTDFFIIRQSKRYTYNNHTYNHACIPRRVRQRCTNVHPQFAGMFRSHVIGGELIAINRAQTQTPSCHWEFHRKSQ